MASSRTFLAISNLFRHSSRLISPFSWAFLARKNRSPYISDKNIPRILNLPGVIMSITLITCSHSSFFLRACLMRSSLLGWSLPYNCQTKDCKNQFTFQSSNKAKSIYRGHNQKSSSQINFPFVFPFIIQGHEWLPKTGGKVVIRCAIGRCRCPAAPSIQSAKIRVQIDWAGMNLSLCILNILSQLT